MRKYYLCLLVLFFLLSACLPATLGTTPDHHPINVQAPIPTATPYPRIQFPLDEGPHGDLTEWWYYTGHLQTAQTASKPANVGKYGFELVIFQISRGAFAPFYAAHFTITDLSRHTFSYDQRKQTGGVVLAPPHYDLLMPGPGGPWLMRGFNGHDHIAAVQPHYALNLDLQAEKPASLHGVTRGVTGLIGFGDAGDSYYYSRTRMTLHGAINDHGSTRAVTGTAWFDHQWGNFISLNGGGYDWYSVQLSNNTELMFYFIRGLAGHTVSSYITYIQADGSEILLHPQDFRIQAIAHWRSPHSGGLYPSGWKVQAPRYGLNLTITPLLRDQELITKATTGVAYWEGDSRVTGAVKGKAISGEAYVELTGYGK